MLTTLCWAYTDKTKPLSVKTFAVPVLCSTGARISHTVLAQYWQNSVFIGGCLSATVLYSTGPIPSTLVWQNIAIVQKEYRASIRPILETVLAKLHLGQWKPLQRQC